MTKSEARLWKAVCIKIKQSAQSNLNMLIVKCRFERTFLDECVFILSNEQSSLGFPYIYDIKLTK